MRGGIPKFEVVIFVGTQIRECRIDRGRPRKLGNGIGIYGSRITDLIEIDFCIARLIVLVACGRYCSRDIDVSTARGKVKLRIGATTFAKAFRLGRIWKIMG